MPTLIEFTGESCPPCIEMAPVIESIKSKYRDKLNVITYSMKNDIEMVNKYMVDAVPMQIFLDSAGIELYRHQDFLSEEKIIERFNKYGIKL